MKKGEVMSEEQKKKIGDANRGRKIPLEVIQRQKETRKKRMLEPEFRKMLRFWESDINKDVAGCVNKIEEALR